MNEEPLTISSVLALLGEADKPARAALACEDRLVDFAAAIPDTAPGFMVLKQGLKALGVAVTDWVRVVRARRIERAKAAARPNGRGPERDPRPVINLSSLEEWEVNAKAARAISGLENLYVRQGQLVRVLDSSRRRPGEAEPYSVTEVRAVSEPLLRDLFTRAARWIEMGVGEGGEPDMRRAHPPDWSVRAVAKAQVWPDIKPLYHVAEVPVILPDGAIVSENGYDEETGILYRPRIGVPEIPDEPTQAECQAAAELLLDIVCDVPFEDPARRSAFLAALLTPIARWAFKGQTPFFLFDANQAGSGKGLLQRIIGWLTIGRELDMVTQTEDEDEERKRFTSKILGGCSALVIDNIDKPFGSPILDALLTTGTWSDRLLGGNEAPSFDVWMVLFGSGNNVTFRRDDMRRRTCVIRIQTDLLRPEQRSGFKHPNLQSGAYVLERRGEFFAAALTVLRGWLRSGLKPTDLPGWGGTWGSFDDWDRVVRGAVVYAGQVDPIAAKATAGAEAASGDLIKLLEGWSEFGETSAADVIELLRENDEYRRGDRKIACRGKKLRDAFSAMISRFAAGALPSTQQIGNLLGKYRGKPIATPTGPRRLSVRTYEGTSLWRVEAVELADASQADIERAAIAAESAPAPAPMPCQLCEQLGCACGVCGRCRNTDSLYQGCCC